MLATVDQLKIRNGIAATDTASDELFSGILEGVSADLARECGRVYDGAPCLEKTALTALMTVLEPRTETLFLPAWPVVSVTSIKESLYGDFAGATALVANTDYQLAGGRGALHRIGYWLTGFLTVQIVYTGGYTSAGEVLATGETALPADLTEAAIQQASFVWQRRRSLGLTGMGASGGSVSSYARDEILPGVQTVCRRYRRMIG